MAQATTPAPPPHAKGFGTTARRDAWWFGPSLTVIGLAAFLIYGTWAAWQGAYYEIRQDKAHFHKLGNHPVAPYLAPFSSPLLYDPNRQRRHAWTHDDHRPG